MVGTGTALLDDPSLTVRNAAGRNPLRIVLDREGRLASNAKLLDQQAETLRGLMQQANAPCWLPDAASEGACPVD